MVFSLLAALCPASRALDLQRLNHLHEHSFQAVVKWKERNTTIESLQRDADEQFSVENCHKIINGSAEAFMDKYTILIEELEDTYESRLALTLELIEEEAKEALRFVRCQKLNRLHIVVAYNHGGKDKSQDVNQQETYLSSNGIEPQLTPEETCDNAPDTRVKRWIKEACFLMHANSSYAEQKKEELFPFGNRVPRRKDSPLDHKKL
ncbi:hypothetical protein ARMSODRAFT_975873 [Armillaria solidipes]|uniref:Uncharacterized protein n=1 Tax=Armillaria solidipes TaxID=1076256 RepID=A0A2H3BV70_9AGAR|nr:hypothetical protein ARMSODRAFT_975873 [Armillaria solidipes]